MVVKIYVCRKNKSRKGKKYDINKCKTMIKRQKTNGHRQTKLTQINRNAQGRSDDVNADRKIDKG